MTTQETAESLEIEELVDSQSNSQQLQIELCVLKSKMQTLELENRSLREETESQKEKIKNFTDYFESIQEDEDTAERLKEELKEKENELQRLSELITEELINSENAQKEYEMEISRLKGELVALETENEQTKIELSKTKESSQLSYDNYFNDLTSLKEEKEAQELFFTKQCETLQNENRQLKEKIDQLQAKHDEMIEANTSSMTELIEKYTNDMKSLQQTQQSASKTFSEGKELKAKLFKLEHEKELLRTEMASKQSLLQEQLKLNKELNETIDKLNEENVAYEGKIGEMKSNMLNDIGPTPEMLNSNRGNDKGSEEIQQRLDEALEELMKYKALDEVIQMNTNHSLLYQDEIRKLKNEVNDFKRKYEALVELQKKNEASQQLQQLKLGAIAEKRLTVKPIETRKIREDKDTAGQSTDNFFQSNQFPKKDSIDYTSHSNDHSSELQKQLFFLTEQNKSYQKDIATAMKNKEEILSQIKALQEKNSLLETQLITKNREVTNYKIQVNRLKLKEKE